MPFFVFTHSTALSGRPRRKLRASCQLVSLWALHNSHSSQNEALLSDPGLIIVSNVLQTKLQFAHDMIKLLHGFVIVVTQIYSAVELN